MMSWEKVELSSVAEYVKDKIDAKLLNTINYISTENMLVDRRGITPSNYLPESGKTCKFNANDILVSNIRPYFKKIWFADTLGGCSNDIIIFRSNLKKIEPKYLYYQLTKDEFFDFMMSGANGTKMPRGNRSSIPHFKIFLPPLSIQHRIASILSAYDDLIENNLKRIKLLEELAQRTYEEYFVKFRINGEQLDVNTETGLPSGWKLGSLMDLVSFQNGFAFKSSKFVEIGQPIIKIKNIGNNTVDILNTDCVEEEYAKSAEKYQLNQGDLLIAMTGATIGKVGYMPYSEMKCYLNQRVGRFLDYVGKSNIHFVFSVMTQGNGLQQVLNFASGAAQPNISGNQILAIQTVIPTENLLLSFNNFTETNIQQILNLQNQNRLLKESRDILLPRLMSGEIEVEGLKEEELAIAAEPETLYKSR